MSESPTGWCKKISSCLKFPPQLCLAKWPAHSQPISHDGTFLTQFNLAWFLPAGAGLWIEKFFFRQQLRSSALFQMLALTSEVIQRPLWPRRPPIKLSRVIYTWYFTVVANTKPDFEVNDPISVALTTNNFDHNWFEYHQFIMGVPQVIKVPLARPCRVPNPTQVLSLLREHFPRKPKKKAR